MNTAGSAKNTRKMVKPYERLQSQGHVKHVGKPYKRLQSQGHVNKMAYRCSKFIMLVACLLVEIIQH